MNSKPLVSVVTITRNRGPIIGRCINSVLSQTYTNIEHIIVDGASTDNTDEVIGSFNDSRIRYIKLEENWAIVKTINYGVEISKGEYITFLDSDDEYLPTKIEKQLALLESLPEDFGMVYCWMTYFDEKTGEICHIHNPSLRGFVPNEVVETPIVSGTPTFFFRRNAFLENKGWRDDIGIVSDWEMAARFCQRWKVDFVPESLINVYVNHGMQRMSANGYYKDFWEKNKIFHEFMLNEFHSSFTQYPQKMIPHLRMLVTSNLMLKDYSRAFTYYRKLLSLSFSIRNISIYPYYLYKRLRYGTK